MCSDADYSNALHMKAAHIARLLVSSGRIPSHSEQAVVESQVVVLSRVAQQIALDLGVEIAEAVALLSDQVLEGVAEEFSGDV